jgi:glycosyltransferase involved in cell wall biosynthesis
LDWQALWLEKKVLLNLLHYMPVYAPAWRFGGPVLSVSRLCEALVRLGHRVEVLTSTAGLRTNEVEPERRTERNGVFVTYFQHTSEGSIACEGMRDAVKARIAEFDLVHITGVWQRTARAACQAAMRSRVPYVISPRGALGPYSWTRGSMKKVAYFLLQEYWNLQGATGIHYTAEQEKEECGWLRLPGRSFVVPNAIDCTLHPVPGQAEHWRESRGLEKRALLLMCVGRLHHKKGLDLLPKSLEPLRGGPWQIVFLGDDEDGTRERLQREFSARGLENQVVFLPAVPTAELPRAYSAADVVLLPSRHENFANVLVEAIACGTPVVTTPQVGLAREIARAQVGLILERDASTWTEMLAKVISNPRSLEAFRERAAPFAAGFTSDLIATRMAKEYADCIRQARETRPT